MTARAPQLSKLPHLETLRADARDEIKRRIEQRDKYSIQMTIALSVIIGVASEKGYQRALIAAPLVSIYFNVLVLYSYRVHSVLAKYLREVLEPELARLHGVDINCEWEHFYKQEHVSGIRKSFFRASLWVVCFVSIAYLSLHELVFKSGPKDTLFIYILAAAGAIYLAACIMITRTLGR